MTSLRTRGSNAFGAFAALLWVVFIAALLAAAGTAGAIAALLVLLLGVFLAYRIFSMAATWDESGLIVRRVFRQTRIPWNEIQGFEIASTGNITSQGRCLGVRLRDGNLRKMKALNGYSGAGTLGAHVERLSGALASRGRAKQDDQTP